MATRAITIALFPLLFFVLTTQAQVSLGIEAGPDFARILNILQGYAASGSTVTQNSQSITRISGGFFLDVPFDKNDQFILQPGLRFRGAGGETPQIIDYNGNLLAGQTRYAFDYIDLPVQLLYSPSFSFGKPWIGGGFYAGALVSATAKTPQGSHSLIIGNDENDDIKRFDLGFNATAGLTLKCGVLVGVDFEQSLAGINPISSVHGSSIKVRNSIWGVHIGYAWSLSRKSHPHN